MESKFFKRIRTCADDETVTCEPEFCAPRPNRFRCRLKSSCASCFEQSQACSHHPDVPLDLILLGHNPSEHAWLHGFAYGDPTNRMWKLLTGNLPNAGSFRGVLPPGAVIETDQNRMPDVHRIGFTDVMLLPGSDASSFSPKQMAEWIPNLYHRLRTHVQRVGDPTYRGPRLVAFTGKRQFQVLFHPARPPKEPRLPFGRLPDEYPSPPNWPFSRQECDIWILPSSSGRAAMSHTERTTPYAELAEALRALRAPCGSAE